MNARSDNDRRTASRRLLAGIVLGVAATLAAGPTASAATTATFSAGVLTVFGDNADNAITISRNAAGAILVNGGAIAVARRHADSGQHDADLGLRPRRQRCDRARRGQRCAAARATCSAARATTS